MQLSLPDANHSVPKYTYSLYSNAQQKPSSPFRTYSLGIYVFTSTIVFTSAIVGMTDVGHLRYERRCTFLVIRTTRQMIPRDKERKGKQRAMLHQEQRKSTFRDTGTFNTISHTPTYSARCCQSQTNRVGWSAGRGGEEKTYKTY